MIQYVSSTSKPLQFRLFSAERRGAKDLSSVKRVILRVDQSGAGSHDIEGYVADALLGRVVVIPKPGDFESGAYECDLILVDETGREDTQVQPILLHVRERLN